MSETVIRVENLSKRYQLGTIGYGSLRHDLQAWWARVRRKDDPNARVGEKSRLDFHGDFWALRDVSFEVKQGERLGIIGRNGAGKSTLLKILSQITRPTYGVVQIKGKVASLLEVGTGFHLELTGRENVFLNGAIMGMKRREIEKKFDEIVDFAGVEEFIDTPVKRYSSGMYVRLGFAVAAYLDPDVLIVDEVLSVGDADFQKRCLRKMEDASQIQGRTIIFVSHNLSALSAICESSLLLEGGSMVLRSSTETVVREYLYKGDSALGFLRQSIDYTKKLTITQVQICDIRNKPKDTFFRGETLKILIEVFVARDLEGVSVSVEVSREGGDVLFVTSSTDMKPGHRTYIVGGTSHYYCPIPLSDFREGLFSVRATAAIPNTEVLDETKQHVRFRVVDLNSPVKRTGEGRKGIILPLIEWEYILGEQGQ